MYGAVITNATRGWKLWKYSYRKIIFNVESKSYHLFSLFWVFSYFFSEFFGNLRFLEEKIDFGNIQ